ncbi:transcriptional regulator, BadM/Rrf2 family [Anaerobranca californiensis DSM 14826]|uniref:Transcriptional regulator, BadM/Rrf2 family n=1 Tax=Anaerobranca californiensis DSM 14826 TaxID=1120989 RepID=A0A1M6KWP4_9FIRM|nr:Rrf2 family transcriptional regulator [Anaerobranca californiensis]SHJ63324.1 transcriptional regulator, BadM/Rrf2 family [Anaerobranca californiensis DSM 14826]
MKISAKGDYACKAVLELAINYHEGKPVQISDIAERQNIPIKFLEQILIILKQGGVTKSKRGAEGGYYLAKPPEEITVADIILLTEGAFVHAPCIPQEDNCKNSVDCVFRPIWQEVEDSIYHILQKTNFKILSEKVMNKEQLMYYI